MHNRTHRTIVLSILLLAWIAIPLSTSAQLYDLPNGFSVVPVSSGTLARTDGGRLVVSNPLADRVSIVNPFDGQLEAEVFIGHAPEGIAITPNSQRALAVSQRAARVGIIDLFTNELLRVYRLPGQPYHVVATNQRAYITLPADDAVIAIDIETGTLLQQIHTPDHPSALALWGDFLFVTHYWTGELSMIYLPTGQVVRTIQAHPSATLSNAIVIDPITELAYLPQTIRRPSDDRMTPVVQVIDLGVMQWQRTIDLRGIDGDYALPYAVAQPSNRSRLYLTYASSDVVSVLNLETDTVEEQARTGINPRGIAFHRSFVQFYVQNAISGTISTYDTFFYDIEDALPSHTQTVAPVEQVGATLFYSARLSDDHLRSCASCHLPDLRAEIDRDWLVAHQRQYLGGAQFAEDAIDAQVMRQFLQRE